MIDKPEYNGELLNICAWCGKMSERVRAILDHYSDANVTHGICEECNNKVMAELDD